MTCTTEKMIAGGSCLARIEGKAIFVPFSLPCELIEIEITKESKDYSFARIISVLNQSPYRVSPACPMFGICGGCTLQMAENSYQSELRLSILQNILERAHVKPLSGIIVETGAATEYRSRFQFHRDKTGKAGLKAASSDKIIPVNDCLIAVPEIRKALKTGEIGKNAENHLFGDRFHVFAYKGRIWQENFENNCVIRLSGKKIEFDVRGFFQSNIPMLERMISIICEDITELHLNRLLDFYSGVGTFSLFAGNFFNETVLVEHNKESLEIAGRNLSSVNIKHTLCAISDEKWASHPLSRLQYDVSIIDPPRQGLSKKAIEWFISSKIPDIRYVSCDPVTFARDAAKLISAGYILKKIKLLDFYPQTHHIETLGFFIR